MYTEVKIRNQNRLNKQEFYSIFGKGCKDKTDTSTFIYIQK